MVTLETRTKEKKRKILLADLGLVFVALFWGGGFVATGFTLQDMTPMNIMAYRLIGATIVMIPFCLKKFKFITKRMLLCGALIGFLIFLGSTLQTIGLQYTTPGKQSFIISLYTVIVPLLSWIVFKTRPGKKIIFAALLALIGIALLTLTDDLTIGFGDILTLIFALTFSIQIILIGIFMKDMDATAFTFVQIAFAAVFSLIGGVITETPINPLTMSTSSILSLIYLITFNTAFAFLLQNICQMRAPANHTAIILSTETVFGTIFAVTLAHEIFRGRMVLGCIFMFIAIIVAEFPGFKKKKTSD